MPFLLFLLLSLAPFTPLRAQEHHPPVGDSAAHETMMMAGPLGIPQTREGTRRGAGRSTTEAGGDSAPRKGIPV